MLNRRAAVVCWQAQSEGYVGFRTTSMKVPNESNHKIDNVAYICNGDLVFESPAAIICMAEQKRR